MELNAHYSAKVEIFIIADGRRIEVASCVQSLCILRSPSKVPACAAELFIIIDDNKFDIKIILEPFSSELIEEVRFKLAA